MNITLIINEHVQTLSHTEFLSKILEPWTLGKKKKNSAGFYMCICSVEGEKMQLTPFYRPLYYSHDHYLAKLLKDNCPLEKGLSESH